MTVKRAPMSARFIYVVEAMPRAERWRIALGDFRRSRTDPPNGERRLRKGNEKIIILRVEWAENGARRVELSYDKIIIAQRALLRQERHLRVVFIFEALFV